MWWTHVLGSVCSVDERIGVKIFTADSKTFDLKPDHELSPADTPRSCSAGDSPPPPHWTKLLLSTVDRNSLTSTRSCLLCPIQTVKFSKARNIILEMEIFLEYWFSWVSLRSYLLPWRQLDLLNHCISKRQNITMPGVDSRNFIKRGPEGECKPITGVWQWSSRAPVGSWFRASSQKKAFSLLSLDKQRTAVSFMGVIVVKCFYHYVKWFYHYVWVSLLMGRISYLDNNST